MARLAKGGRLLDNSDFAAFLLELSEASMLRSVREMPKRPGRFA